VDSDDGIPLGVGYVIRLVVRGLRSVRGTLTMAFRLVFAAAGILLIGSGCAGRDQTVQKIELLARAPERGNWSPQTIEVEKGKEVTLVIRNVDIVTHGFYLPDFGISEMEIKAGDVREVSFTPNVAGEFTFYCSIWCSDYHMHMRGTLIVR
jgi:cytochrome c oxidase subunit 2